MCVATSEPAIFPTITGTESSSPCLRLKAPFLKNVIVAVKFCKKTAIRLVPLAMVIGRPNAVNIVTVTTEPPPASVFIAPTIMPEMTKISVILKSNSITFPISQLKSSKIFVNLQCFTYFCTKLTTI